MLLKQTLSNTNNRRLIPFEGEVLRHIFGAKQDWDIVNTVSHIKVKKLAWAGRINDRAPKKILSTTVVVKN
jgi:hypothetical protein